MTQNNTFVKSIGYICFLFFTLLPLNGCSNSNNQHHAKTTSIDMIEANEIDFDDLVEDVNCVVLEDSPDAFLHDSWKIIRYKQFYYLYSLSDFAVCVFDNKGNLVNRIEGRGSGAIETPCDIYIEETKDQLWIIESRCFVNKYSLSGEFINKEELPFNAVKLTQTYKGNYLFYTGGFDKENNYYIIQTTPDFNTTVYFVEKTIENYRKIPPSLFTVDNDSRNIYSLLPNNDTIYICNKDEQFKPFFHLDFKDKLLTFKEFPAKGFKDKEMADIINKNERIYNITGFNFASGLLFMQLQGQDNSYRAVNLETQTPYKFSSLIDNASLTSIATNIQGSTSTSLLLSIPANQFLNEYSKYDNNTQYSSIKKLLDNPESVKNRVIIEIIIKNKL